MKNNNQRKPSKAMGKKSGSLFLRAGLILCAIPLLVQCGDMADTDAVYQGGDLTIFDNTTLAYDTPSPVVLSNPALEKRFRRGDLLYETPRVANPAPNYGGLGPLYTGKSCTTCHAGAGRTIPTLFTHGGTGKDFSTFLAFIRSKNNQPFREYGRVLHDHAIYGVRPEGRLTVTYEETFGTLPDGESYSLIRPRYKIDQWYAGSIAEDELVLSVRIPLRHVGMGLMMALDREELKALAAMRYPEYNISGKLQWVYERGRWDIGISGHKAQHSDLTVELGFSSNFGVTNPRFPDEICLGQEQCTEDFGIEISSQDMADVDLYMHASGVPARRNVDNAQVRKGEEMFYRAKCHLCHTPTLHTSRTPPPLIDGTYLPFLANQTIHPYSDFLLHDMGPDLGDDYSQFNAHGDEWRTTPLWGIGLQKIVNGHTYFLHDGRARNLLEAILWHAQEEGAASYQIFIHLPKEDRDALIAFLNSL
jgi:CxxC motif-containing protein (DUF1111 family)